MSTKRWTILLLVAVLGLSACQTKGQKVTAFTGKNQQKMAQLRIGMSKAQLIELMGTETVVTITNPMRSESFMTESGKVAEVLYYCTRLAPVFGRCTDRGQTPVVLMDGVVAGWGNGYAQSLPYRAQDKGFHITVDSNTNKTIRQEGAPPDPATPVP